MDKEKEWEKDEFDILLDNFGLSDEELSDHLPNRTLGAIKVVRDFIHSYHRVVDPSGLSEMMKDSLKQGSCICHRCQELIKREATP